MGRETCTSKSDKLHELRRKIIDASTASQHKANRNGKRKLKANCSDKQKQKCLKGPVSCSNRPLSWHSNSRANAAADHIYCCLAHSRKCPSDWVSHPPSSLSDILLYDGLPCSHCDFIFALTSVGTWGITEPFLIFPSCSLFRFSLMKFSLG